MKPADYYRKLVWSITEADVRLVAGCIAEHVGMENAVRLDRLADRTGMNERKVREILSTLTTQYGWPVGAMSGKAGRWLIANEAERDMVLADLNSRVAETQSRVRALRQAKLAPLTPDTLQVDQPAMFDVRESETQGFWQAHWGR